MEGRLQSNIAGTTGDPQHGHLDLRTNTSIVTQRRVKSRPETENTMKIVLPCPIMQKRYQHILKILMLIHNPNLGHLLIQLTMLILSIKLISGIKATNVKSDTIHHTSARKIMWDRCSIRDSLLIVLPECVVVRPGTSRYTNSDKHTYSKMPTVLHEVTGPFKKATFGMGCFWACDALFGAQQGVLRTRVGYSGGTTLDPVYKKMGDHTEVIEIDYDPKVISYEDLLELFWNNHEYGLTTVIKRQYMSLILYHNEDQKRIAEISLKKEAHKRNEKLITEIASAGPFYPAENYHQKYRLQAHAWLCEALGLTPELLQTSHTAARLNSYIAGVGNEEDFEKDIVTLGLTEKMANYVRRQFQENAGGNLYC